jgi:hypothetical protein
MNVTYEFCINEMDGCDIVENHFYDSLDELLTHLPQFVGDDIKMEVVRRSGNQEAGETERGYVGFTLAGLVGDFFDCGNSVPNKIKKQFTELQIFRNPGAFTATSFVPRGSP